MENEVEELIEQLSDAYTKKQTVTLLKLDTFKEQKVVLFLKNKDRNLDT